MIGIYSVCIALVAPPERGAARAVWNSALGEKMQGRSSSVLSHDCERIQMQLLQPLNLHEPPAAERSISFRQMEA